MNSSDCRFTLQVLPRQLKTCLARPTAQKDLKFDLIGCGTSIYSALAAIHGNPIGIHGNQKRKAME